MGAWCLVGAIVMHACISDDAVGVHEALDWWELVYCFVVGFGTVGERLGQVGTDTQSVVPGRWRNCAG